MLLICGVDEEWRQALEFLGLRGGETILVLSEELVEALEVLFHFTAFS
jgi:hypothetical protein